MYFTNYIRYHLTNGSLTRNKYIATLGYDERSCCPPCDIYFAIYNIACTN